jgi:hypothetical protein
VPDAVADAAPPPVDGAPPPDVAPGKKFTCGIAQCNGASEYCMLGTGGGSGFQCVPFPDGCASNPTCQCLQAATGAQQCNGMNGALTLTEL